MHANALARLALIFEGETGRTIIVDLISVPSHEVSEEIVLVNTELGSSCMDQIGEFLGHDKLPKDKREAHKL